MAKPAKNILTLNHEEAMDFFMKSEQYHGFELPEYFTFDEALKYFPKKKLCHQPNSDYNQFWLQNITYTQDKKKGTSPYSLYLCQLVAGKEIQSLWNNVWLNSDSETDVVEDKTYAVLDEGDSGEQIVWKDLQKKYLLNKDYKVIWVIRDLREPRYDFRIENDKTICYYDAKTTFRGLDNIDGIPFYEKIPVGLPSKP